MKTTLRYFLATILIATTITNPAYPWPFGEDPDLTEFVGHYNKVKGGDTFECFEIRKKVVLLGKEALPADDFDVKDDVIHLDTTIISSAKLMFDEDEDGKTRVTLVGKLFGVGFASAEYEKVDRDESICAKSSDR